jgi:hypothetical protein
MKGRRKPFALRLPISIHDEAEKRADLEGTSLNHFITLAVAEKLIRMESQATEHTQTTDQETPEAIPQEG